MRMMSEEYGYPTTVHFLSREGVATSAMLDGDVYVGGDSDEAMSKSLGSALGNEPSAEALATWVEKLQPKSIDAVVLRNRRDLALLPRFRPATVVFKSDYNNNYLSALLDLLKEADWLVQLSLELDGDSHGTLSKTKTLEKLARLRRVHLAFDYKETLDPKPLAGCRTLEVLELHFRKVGPLPRMDSLKELRVKCPHSDTFTFDWIATSQAPLRRLFIEGPVGAHEKGFSCKPLATLADLEVIRLEGVSARDVAALGALRSLRELEIAGWKKKEKLDVGGMSQLVVLETQDVEVTGLQSLRGLRILKVSALPDPRVLAESVQLERLTVFDAPKGYDLAPLSQLPRLKYLSFDQEYKFTAKQLAPIAHRSDLEIQGDGKTITAAALAQKTKR